MWKFDALSAKQSGIMYSIILVYISERYTADFNVCGSYAYVHCANHWKTLFTVVWHT